MSNTTFQPITIGRITFRSVDGSYQLHWLEGQKRITVFLEGLDEEDLEWILESFPRWISDLVLGGQDVLNAKALADFYAACKGREEASNLVGLDDRY